MIQLFSHPVYRRFLAPRCSIAYLFSWLCSISVVVVPFFLCFSPEHMRGDSTEGGLWIKNKSYREQPKLHFRQEIILIAQVIETKVNSTTNERINRHKALFFSTSSELNKLHPTSFRMASLKSRETDRNLDDIVDAVDIQVMIPLLPEENVYSIQMVSFFDFVLNNHVKIHMRDALAYMHYTSGIPFTAVVSKGDLKLKQRALFSVHKSPSTLYVDDPLFDGAVSLGRSYESTIQHVLDKADSRLFSTEYLERYPTPKRIETIKGTGYDFSALNISMTVHNSAQNIEYIPALYELFTDSWIRYFSLYWIAMKLMQQFYSFAYPNQLIVTFEKIDRTQVYWSKKHN